jgi:hypothetical protein
MQFRHYVVGPGESVKYVIKQYNIDTLIGQSRRTVRQNGLHVCHAVCCGNLLCRLDVQGIDVERVDLSRFAHQSRRLPDVTARAAPVVENAATRCEFAGIHEVLEWARWPSATNRCPLRPPLLCSCAELNVNNERGVVCETVRAQARISNSIANGENRRDS